MAAKEKRCGYHYVEIGDTCDGYPRACEQTWSIKNIKTAIAKMYEDAEIYARGICDSVCDTKDRLDVEAHTEIIEDSDRQITVKSYGEIKCQYSIFEITV